MMGRSHLVISTGLTLSVLGLMHSNISLPVIAISAISALLPDIDEPNSLIVSKTLPTGLIHFLKLLVLGIAVSFFFFGGALAPWNLIISVLAVISSLVSIRTFRNALMMSIGIMFIFFGHAYSPWSFIIGCLLIVCTLVPHRGLTHSAYGVAGWSLLLFFSTHTYSNSLWIAGGLSYLIHLLADSLTDQGIRPLPPFKFRVRLQLMSTGRLSGTVVENACIGLTIVLLWFVFFRGIDINSLTIG